MISINDIEFKCLTEYIKSNYGINLNNKRNLIEGRLSNILVENGFDNFSDYMQYIFSDETKMEITKLIDKVTTNHTFFMREANHFAYLRDKILPYLEEKCSQNKDLRIWSAGCSSGEEPYTIVMIIADYFRNQKILWDTKILASDISAKVLESAERGIYNAESIESLPVSWKKCYFTKVDSLNYEISSKIKSEVVFRMFNLMDATFPFKKRFHVIFCRNVMIYFDHVTKMEIINKFYDLTEPGGYLFIGHAESINRNETKYQYIMPAVYRKPERIY